MTVVKGTKPSTLKVVKDRPVLRASVMVLAVLLMLLSGEFLYSYGVAKGMAGQQRALENLQELRSELDMTVKEKKRLAQELENTKVGVEVDQESLEQVRLEVFELKSQIAALEEDNKFYRNLMAPAGNKRGLTFGAVEMVKVMDRTYRFKVVMQQLATNHQLLNGSLSVNIIGRMEGAVVVLPLKDLAPDIEATNIKLRFKYFQNVEAELTLPDGFVQERIELEARSTGKGATMIEKRLAWLAEEIVE